MRRKGNRKGQRTVSLRAWPGKGPTCEEGCDSNQTTTVTARSSQLIRTAEREGATVPPGKGGVAAGKRSAVSALEAVRQLLESAEDVAEEESTNLLSTLTRKRGRELEDTDASDATTTAEEELPAAACSKRLKTMQQGGSSSGAHSPTRRRQMQQVNPVPVVRYTHASRKVDIVDVQRLLRVLCGATKRGAKDWSVSGGQNIGRTFVVLAPYVEMENFQKMAMKRNMPFLSSHMGAKGSCFAPMRNMFVFRTKYCALVQRLFAVTPPPPPHLMAGTPFGSPQMFRPPVAALAEPAATLPAAVPCAQSYVLSDAELSSIGFPNAQDVLRDQEWTELSAPADSPNNSVNALGPVRSITRLIDDPDFENIFAIDCEMCGTDAGSELTRISVVNARLEVLYDSLVVPDRPILDYRTQWSGVSEETLRHVKTKLTDVQKDLKKLISKRGILVGHSLDNDLKALKISHRRVIDTSVLYPHKNPLKLFSLSELVRIFLGDSLSRHEGHSSVDDARAAMKLLLLKIQQGPDFGGRTRSAPPIPLAFYMLGKTACPYSTPEVHSPQSAQAPPPPSQPPPPPGLVDPASIDISSAAAKTAVKALEALRARRTCAVVPEIDEGPPALRAKLPDAILMDSHGCQFSFGGANFLGGVETARFKGCNDTQVVDAAVDFCAKLPPCERGVCAVGATAVKKTVPLVVVTLRDHQRALSQGSGIPDGAPYAFESRVKALLRRRAQLMEPPTQLAVAESAEEQRGATDHSSAEWFLKDPFAVAATKEGADEGDDTSDGPSDEHPAATVEESGTLPSDETDAEVLDLLLTGKVPAASQYAKVLFPMPNDGAMNRGLESIDSSVSRLYMDAMRPGDVLVFVSCCGNAARYFSLSEARKQMCSPQLLPDWADILDANIKRSRNSFFSPCCLVCVRQNFR